MRYAVLLLVLASCASSGMAWSLREPGFLDVRYGSIIAQACIAPSGMRQIAESQLCDRIMGAARATGTRAATSIGLVGVGQRLISPASAEGQALVRAGIKPISGYDAILEIRLESSGTGTYYKPVSAYHFGTWASGGYYSATFTTGGHNVTYPWAVFGARLVDMATGKSVWHAGVSTAGGEYAGWHTLIKTMAARISERLKADRMLGPPPDGQPAVGITGRRQLGRELGIPSGPR